MAAVTATLCCTLLFVGVIVFVSGGQKIITADPGQDVTLTCRAPDNNIVGKWDRADLGDEHVLLYRDEQFVPDNQHPSFKNRVDLQDRQMKDGDVSLILKNVTTADSGTYQCRVVQRVREPMKLICIIYLRVVVPPGPTGGTTEDGGKEDGEKEDGRKEDSGKKDGSVGLIVGLSVSPPLLVVVVAGFLIYRKHKQRQDPYPPSAELHQSAVQIIKTCNSP